MAGNWFAPCPKNSNKSHYPDCLDMPICPWCRTPNPAFPQGPDPTPPQALQPPAPPLQLEQPTTLVQSTEESSLVTPAVRQLVYSPQPPSKPKSLPKRTNLGQFGQSHRSVTTTPAVGTHVSQARVFSQQQASSSGSKFPQLPTAGTADMNNLPQTQNPLVESFDIVWRFYIIDYNVDPPHRSFINITPWPAHQTLRETYKDECVAGFDLFIEWYALSRVQHSGYDGESYRTMIEREFEARGITERLQIYRKLPSIEDPSEATSSWDSYDGKMLSEIVLQANETIFKPTPKGSRKAGRIVDYYVFDVGIIREAHEGSTRSSPTHEFPDLDEFRPPNSPDNDVFEDANSQNNDDAQSDNDAESVQTVSSKLTSLSLGAPMARSTPVAPPAPAASTSATVVASTSAAALAEMQLLQEGSNRKRAVSKTAVTSSSKRVVSRGENFRYQTRSKDQQQ